MRYAPNREEAIEIMNDGFLKVFQRISTFDSNRPFKAWLSKIMVNTAIDFLRSKKKLVFTDQAEHYHELGKEDNVVEKLSYDELLMHVQSLSPAYRTVFNLYVMEGYQHHEIAVLLGISQGTSKSNLFKAKKILQEKILIAAGKGATATTAVNFVVHKNE
ncbi:sigma-70 family RNA polymerase sigma factor [Chitinophaga oryzae]|uniref:Sigma-70 family RNA polymerase sigma factor n=2 Tax=Chitinophaga oryzae TaxID=2725414 RepID=A0AAE6ZNX8_9BACT|nr:sigma-70 family RNA polymerase sigma factor [Chitinophaga oryzae]QJB42743.1 sigma-70 family RNA polymerase sigma factor [Chitinophaga oryzae]